MPIEKFECNPDNKYLVGMNLFIELCNSTTDEQREEIYTKLSKPEYKDIRWYQRREFYVVCSEDSKSFLAGFNYLKEKGFKFERNGYHAFDARAYFLFEREEVQKTLDLMDQDGYKKFLDELLGNMGGNFDLNLFKEDINKFLMDQIVKCDEKNKDKICSKFELLLEKGFKVENLDDKIKNFGYFKPLISKAQEREKAEEKEFYNKISRVIIDELKKYNDDPESIYFQIKEKGLIPYELGREDQAKIENVIKNIVDSNFNDFSDKMSLLHRKNQYYFNESDLLSQLKGVVNLIKILCEEIKQSCKLAIVGVSDIESVVKEIKETNKSTKLLNAMTISDHKDPNLATPVVSSASVRETRAR